MNKIRISNIEDKDSDIKNNSFTGDIQQFYQFLEERLGTKKLLKIREIIKK